MTGNDQLLKSGVFDFRFGYIEPQSGDAAVDWIFQPDTPSFEIFEFLTKVVCGDLHHFAVTWHIGSGEGIDAATNRFNFKSPFQAGVIRASFIVAAEIHFEPW